MFIVLFVCVVYCLLFIVYVRGIVSGTDSGSVSVIVIGSVKWYR